MAKVDLSDLLGAPEGTNVISFDDLIRKPVKSKRAMEVVLFWTDWTCKCGRHYEMPTYGDTLTLYHYKVNGEVTHIEYEKYLPVCHANLPRRIESRHIRIQHCPSCLHEDTLHSQQLELLP